MNKKREILQQTGIRKLFLNGKTFSNGAFKDSLRVFVGLVKLIVQKNRCDFMNGESIDCSAALAKFYFPPACFLLFPF